MIVLIITISHSFAQQQVVKKVNMENLGKIKDKFYLVDSFPHPYSGEAFSLFPNKSETVMFYWKITKGVVQKFVRYSESGYVVSEENYNVKGIYNGKYFSANEKGDTLLLGNYISGKRDGRWLIMSDGSKKIINYRSGVVVQKR